MAKTVADQFADILAVAGVKRIYGIVGDSLNALTEALRRRGTIEWIHVRHEEVAAFAAAGEAEMTGSLAVCAGSCGPGNLHLINGLFDAHRSRVPVLAIAAQIPSAEIGGGYFQETHPQNLFRECSHYCELVSDESQLPFVLENAIRAAVGLRGVAVVAMPGDVAFRSPPKRALSTTRGLTLAAPKVVPQADELKALADLLNGAGRITLFCGRGCAGAHAPLMQLAEALKSPIVHALGGKEHVEYDNPYDVGMTGFIGFSSGYAAMHACDALVMLGTDFPYKQFFPTDCQVAQIDIRPENLGRRCKIDLGLVGDVKLTIEALLPRLETKTQRKHLDDAIAHYKRAREGLDSLAKGTPGSKPIHPQYLAKVISDHASDDAVFTADVGTPAVWAARYLTMNGRRRIIGSFNHGSMANALPQALGVQGAYPGRQVVSMSGDGGLTMLMGDMLTAVQMKLPVKIVVFNNSTLGFVALEQKAAGYVDDNVSLQNPDFGAIAREMGYFGVRVTRSDALEGVLREAFAHDGPALVDVVTETQELIMPPKIQAEQIKGFSLYAARAVLSGRGDEVLELARANLFR